jgi:hypothetical protein
MIAMKTITRARKGALLVATLVAALATATSSTAYTHPTVTIEAANAAHAQPASGYSLSCKSGYYKNVSGHCVKRPGSDPTGATARCADGSYSYSQHASGTCSHHGGVARWIHHP